PAAVLAPGAGRGAGAGRALRAGRPVVPPARPPAPGGDGRHLRAGLDRPVHRPPRRRRQAFVLQGPAVPADRAAVAAGFRLPPPQPADRTGPARARLKPASAATAAAADG